MARLATTYVWQPKEGRVPDWLANVRQAKALHEGLGASVSVWRVMNGQNALAFVYRVEFEDAEAYGKFSDAMQEQGFMAEFPAENAAATLVNAVFASEVEL